MPRPPRPRVHRAAALTVGVAAVRAVAVVVPLTVAAGLGRPAVGAAGSFGAYLMVAAFSSLSGRPRGTVLLVGALGLGLWAAAGALAAALPSALVAGTAVVAALQGLWEVAGGPLRMAASMAALSFLLAEINLAPGVRWWQYAAGFAGGALWQAGVIAVTGPASGPTPARCVADLRARAREGAPYATTVVATGVLGVATAWFLPIPHAVWLATSALRVTKPDTVTRHGRARDRVVGTIGGGMIAALLLTPPLTVPQRATIVAVTLCAMHLAGAAHYGWWTLCLTVVALSFDMRHGAGDWQLAAVRMGLTVAGAALALAVGGLTDRCGARPPP
ncbi:FUSC family protein [Streptomyces sp. NPDC048664]|uniref:FUSC family protein n=1 Tax=Streptomyces sp. NPDC048664 TaxID=3154505 RepID=UPI00341A5FF7